MQDNSITDIRVEHRHAWKLWKVTPMGSTVATLSSWYQYECYCGAVSYEV